MFLFASHIRSAAGKSNHQVEKQHTTDEVRSKRQLVNTTGDTRLIPVLQKAKYPSIMQSG